MSQLAGSIVQFHCATQLANVSLSWIGVDEVDNVTMESKPMMISLTFTATAKLNGTSVVCSVSGVFNGTGVYYESTAARLLVQSENIKTLSIDF